MSDFEAKARAILRALDIVYGDDDERLIVSALEDAVKEENEACAKVAENALGYGGVPCTQAAKLIRSRTQKENPDV